MSRPCECGRVVRGEAFALGRDCRLCWLAEHDPRFRAAWGVRPGPGPDRPAAPRGVGSPPVCRHRGERVATGDVARRGLPVLRDWYPCGKGRGADGLVCPCLGCGPACPEYEAEPAPDTPARRHLLFHLLPVAGNGAWRRNLDQLKWRADLFTGRRVVAVGTGGVNDTVTHRGAFALDPPAAVAEYLGPGWDVVPFPNDPALREVASWPLLWARLEDLAGTDDPVFYAQAKGVTRPFNPGVTVHPWTRMLYSSLLDFWPVVEAELARWPIAGSFKKVGAGFAGSASSWHYSGSFFWVRCSEAFKFGRAHRIDRAWWGNEAWPGLHFPPAHAGVVFKEGAVPALDLYSPPHVFGQVVPEFRAWCAANACRRTDWTSVASAPR